MEFPRGRATVTDERPQGVLEVRPGHGIAELERDAKSHGAKMTDIALSPEIAVPKPIPLGELWPWVVLGTLLALIAIYFVGTEQGATSLISGTFVHEWVHDSRHLLGFPCH